MHKLRTVDVWDTLLRRKSHPDCIKLATARHLMLMGKLRSRPERMGQWELYHARIAVERRQARVARDSGHDAEYELNAVMRQWLDEVELDDTSARDTVQLARDLAETELRFEHLHATADPDILDFLNAYPAPRTVFLSDFYMSATVLGALLHAKGLNQIAVEGISSSDVGFNKRSGRLFRHVHALYDIQPHEHVHIGDDAWADVAAARRNGVTAVRYLPAAGHASRLRREWLFLSRQILFAHVRSTCREEAGCIDHVGDSRDAFTLGIEAAPLFVGFMLWIAEEALLSKIERVWFPAATGVFLKQLYAGMFPRQWCFEHQVPLAGVLSGDVEPVPVPGSTSLSETNFACFTWQRYLGDGEAGAASLAALNLLCASVSPLRTEDISGVAFAASFRQGVSFAISRWRPYVEDYVVGASEVRNLSVKILDAFGTHDFRQLARDAATHSSSDIFDLTPPSSCHVVPTLSTILLAGIDRRRRAQLSWFIKRVRWTAVVQNGPDLGHLHRGCLLLAFSLVHALRSVKSRVLR